MAKHSPYPDHNAPVLLDVWRRALSVGRFADEVGVIEKKEARPFLIAPPKPRKFLLRLLCSSLAKILKAVAMPLTY